MDAIPNKLNTLLASLSNIEDARIDRKKLYPLNEILFMTTSAVLSGFEEWDEIVDFGNAKLDWLRKYLPFENGIPSHDTVNRVISMIDFRAFIDGKRLCGSASKKEQQTSHSEGGKSAVHLVHAWCHELQLCLAQYKTESKSNEITAIPAMLDLLEISGCIITLDAMGCQKKVVEKIIDKEGDYIIGLKGNQEQLRLAATTAFGAYEEQAERSQDLWEVRNHGRIEARLCSVLPVNMLPESAIIAEWKGLKSIVQVISKRTLLSTGVTEYEARYYISSLDVDSQSFNRLVRSHWNVENQLHWSLDVIFGEDMSRKRIRNAAQNFSTIRKIALNLLKASDEKISINRKRNKCALSDQYREKTMGF
jgi:predicted transposase YbfD/YdcC